jgi:hypothetical protein
MNSDASTRTFTLTRLVGAMACMAWLASAPAMAQSSYAMTVLNPLTAGTTLDTVFDPWAIDANDVVVSGARQFGAYEKFLFSIGLQGFSTYYAVKWSATTAASVAPKKIYSSARAVLAVSKGGTKLLVNYDRQNKFYGVLDARTGALSSTTGMPMSGEVISDVGVVGWSGYPSSDAYGTWSPSAGVVTLSGLPGEGLVSLFAINRTGLVAGNAVRGAFQGFVAQGSTVQYLEPDDTSASVVRDLTDGGKVLVERYKTTGCEPLTDACKVVPPSTSAIWQQGVFTPLVSSLNGKFVVATHLNNQGVVLGRAFDDYDQSQGEITGRGRAVIWVNGVPTDLTDWVNAKGAGIKAGQYINRVVALNDRGSLVGSLYDPVKKAESVVRLSARP